MNLNGRSGAGCALCFALICLFAPQLRASGHTNTQEPQGESRSESLAIVGGVGYSAYQTQNDPHLERVTYVNKDAGNLSGAFRKAGFHPVQRLVNGMANRVPLYGAFKSYAAAGPYKLVVVYLSMQAFSTPHGIYLVTNDSELQHVSQKGASLREILHILAGYRTENMLVILDICRTLYGDRGDRRSPASTKLAQEFLREAKFNAAVMFACEEGRASYQSEDIVANVSVFAGALERALLSPTSSSSPASVGDLVNTVRKDMSDRNEKITRPRGGADARGRRGHRPPPGSDPEPGDAPDPNPGADAHRTLSPERRKAAQAFRIHAELPSDLLSNKGYQGVPGDVSRCPLPATPDTGENP